MLEFYGLREHPFGVSPNPRYLYPSLQHREALASLINGIDDLVGFAALIAEPGAGKTTLLFDVLLRYRERANTAFVFNTQCSGIDLLRHIVMELQIPGGEAEQDPIRLHQIFTSFVADRTRTKPVVIIIDEAQNLEASALETLRLLSNFEAADRKLLHIILAGQPQLREKLRSNALTQLRQRIMIISRLGRLSPEQTEECIAFRLRVAGYAGSPLFSEEALAKIKVASGGVPREINRICINALQVGFALRQNPIGVEIIEEVLSDLDLDHEPEPRAEVSTTPPWTGLKLEEVFPKTPVQRKDPIAVPKELPPQSLVTSGPALPKNIPPKPTVPQVAEVIAKAPFPIAESFGVGVQNSGGVGAVATQRAMSPTAEAKPATNIRPVPTNSSPAISQTSVARSPDTEKLTKTGREKEEHKVQPGISTAVMVIPLCCAMFAAFALFILAGVVHVPPQLLAASSWFSSAHSSTSPNGNPPVSTSSPTASSDANEAQDASTESQRKVSGEVVQAPAVRKVVVVNREPARARTVATVPMPIIPSYAIDHDDVVPGRRRQPVAMAAPNALVSPPPPIANNGLTAISRTTFGAENRPKKESSVTAPASALRVADDGKNVLKKFVRPVFPPEAKQMHLAGEVSLHVDIAGDGSVREIHVLSGDPVLARAAQSAVEQWQYQSTQVNGSPAKSEEKIIVSFRETR